MVALFMSGIVIVNLLLGKEIKCCGIIEFHSSGLLNLGFVWTSFPTYDEVESDPCTVCVCYSRTMCVFEPTGNREIKSCVFFDFQVLCCND